MESTLFQSTLPRRERQGDKVVSSFKLQISIHAPAKGATNSEKTDKNLPWNFNPRSREGSDEFDSVYEFFKKAFQSTLPRRERPVSKKRIQIKAKFQSTLPRRERRAPRLTIPNQPQISIHAPAKGATVHARTLYKGHLFQSTLPRRERRDEYTRFLIRSKFQSTLPRRERRLYQMQKRLNLEISIHAPAKGATSLRRLS